MRKSNQTEFNQNEFSIFTWNVLFKIDIIVHFQKFFKFISGWQSFSFYFDILIFSIAIMKRILNRTYNWEVDTCASFSSGVVGGIDDPRLFAVCLLDAVHCQPSQLALAQSHEAISSGYSCACVHSPWTDHFDPGNSRHKFTLVVDIFVVLEFQQDLTRLHILSTEQKK